MDEARKLWEDARQYVDGLLSDNDALSRAREQASATAQHVVRSTRLEVARMEAATAEQLQEAKNAVQYAAEEAHKYEALFFSQLKGGVNYAVTHRTEAAAGATTLFLLSLPGTRRFLYRRTVGRFRTPEGLVESAEKRLEDLKQGTELLKNDAAKLQDRAAMAEQEFLSGRSKLRATAAELKRVSSSLGTAETKARSLKQFLAELPAKDSVRLRAELANANHELRQQAVLLERRAWSIARLGIGI